MTFYILSIYFRSSSYKDKMWKMSWPARRAVLWMFEHPHLDEAPQSSDDMAGFAKAVVKNPAFHCGKSKKTLDFPTAGRTLACVELHHVERRWSSKMLGIKVTH